IRAFHVTGVQTCALPICGPRSVGAGFACLRRCRAPRGWFWGRFSGGKPRTKVGQCESDQGAPVAAERYLFEICAFLGSRAGCERSEERRVGKEWRARGES